MFRIGFLFFLLLFSIEGWGQSQLRGVLKDSVNSRFLHATTISVYKKGNKLVETVTLSDKYGEFTLKDLPYGAPLRIAFSHVQYQGLAMELQLDKNEKADLGLIYLSPRSELIDTVTVLLPVRMKGDTIEFYADAFQLDTNAVIEDLIHKLPGMMIWGDGKITYNGREIPSVLVNGKPFFGTDKAIALQNIAKDAVDKLQVYDKRSEEIRRENEMDPQYEMNVVLKDGKEKMYFGNATAAVGSGQRMDGHLNFNYADKARQSTMAFSTNNTNQRLSSIDQLLKNTTFKGVGVRSDFSPDFLNMGIQTQQIGGIRYQHDFLTTKDVNRNNLITATALFNRHKNRVQDTATVELLTNNIDQINNRYYNNKSTNENQTFDAGVSHQYQKMLGNRMINLDNSFSFRSADRNDHSSNLQIFDYANNQSLNIADIKNDVRQSDVNLKFLASIGRRVDASQSTKKSGSKNPHTLLDRSEFTIQGSVHLDNSSGFKRNNSVFENHLNSDLNKFTNRTYDHAGSNSGVSLSTSIRTDDLTIHYLIDRQGSKSHRDVRDLVNDVFVDVSSLTHVSDYEALKHEAAIGYSVPLVRRQFTGRYQKTSNLSLRAGTRWYTEQNSSSLDFRNLEQDFFTFLPEIRFDHKYSRDGHHTRNSSFSYAYDEIYPTIDMQRPFYDDIYPAYRFFGGSNLEKYGQHRWSVEHRYSQQKRHGLTAKLGVNYTLDNANWADSIRFVQNQERRFLTQNNTPRNSFGLDMTVEQSFILTQKQSIGLLFDGNVVWNDGVQYLNDVVQNIVTNDQRYSLNLHYSYNNKLVIGVINDVRLFKRRMLKATQNHYQSTSINSGLSLSFLIGTKLVFNTSTTNRFITSRHGDNNAFIWNANIGYRLSKGNNFEVKFSGLDLLKQNQSFYFETSSTDFRQGYRNNLTQYFMVSLSYFPRKFGWR